MNNFETTFAQWVLRHRLLIILGCLALVCGLSYGAGKLAFDTSYRAFFSDDNPELLAFESIENTYVKDDNVMLVIAPHDGNVFTNQSLAAIAEMTSASWQVPYSNRVDSITNFQFTEAEADDLVVRDMVSNPLSLSAEDLSQVRKNVLAEPALINRLVSLEGHVTAINITTQMAVDERAYASGEIIAFVRAMIAEYQQKYPEIDIRLTGMVVMDTAFFENAMYDTTVLFPISLALMVGLIALLVGRFFGTLTTFLVIVLSICAAMGTGGHIGYPLTGMATSAPIIILTVAVANCVHLLVTFTHELHQGKDKIEAMTESLRVNLQPVALASVTTAIGFLSMNFSEVPPFAHLGT